MYNMTNLETSFIRSRTLQGTNSRFSIFYPPTKRKKSCLFVIFVRQQQKSISFINFTTLRSIRIRQFANIVGVEVELEVLYYLCWEVKYKIDKRT